MFLQLKKFVKSLNVMLWKHENSFVFCWFFQTYVKSIHFSSTSSAKFKPSILPFDLKDSLLRIHVVQVKFFDRQEGMPAYQTKRWFSLTNGSFKIPCTCFDMITWYFSKWWRRWRYLASSILSNNPAWFNGNKSDTW